MAFFCRTTWLSRHRKGKPFWILLEQEMMGWRWHQLDHMQIICTSLQTDNHTSTSPLRFLQAGCPFCRQTNNVKALNAIRTWNKPLLIYWGLSCYYIPCRAMDDNDHLSQHAARNCEPRTVNRTNVPWTLEDARTSSYELLPLTWYEASHTPLNNCSQSTTILATLQTITRWQSYQCPWQLTCDSTSNCVKYRLAMTVTVSNLNQQLMMTFLRAFMLLVRRLHNGHPAYGIFRILAAGFLPAG